MVNNIFIVNTSFQRYICETIIQQKFTDASKYVNTIISTVPKQEISLTNLVVIHIRKNIQHIVKDLRSVCAFMKKSILMADSSCFFVPHVNNLISSYIYTHLTSQKSQIAVYYEGMALFYAPIVKLPRYKIAQRYVLGFLSGMHYEHFATLYPEKLRSIATAYTPTPKFATEFKKQEYFTLPTVELSGTRNEILLLLPPFDMEQDYADVKSVVDYVVLHHKNALVYLKPHFENREEILKKIISYGSENGVTFHILEKEKIVEHFIVSKNIGTIYTSYFSSALINLRLMYGDALEINLVCKDALAWSKYTHSFNVNVINSTTC